MKEELKNKVCVISLTYNRPYYIKRSINSLYQRAGFPFDLYIFDDNSNEETQYVLKELQEKYGFNLIINKNRTNIYINFCNAILQLPDDYKYYVKFDSDIELLTDDLFAQVVEVFTLRNKKVSKMSGMIPRTEGMFNFERYPNDVEFYNGHAIRFKTSVCFGCCVFFSNEVFKMFKIDARNAIREKVKTKWGVDTRLYDTILSVGTFAVIEDLSVYHIDNSFGQRKDFNYFVERNRWSTADIEDVWYLKASRLLYPKQLNRIDFEKIRKVSTNFEDFFENCKLYLKDRMSIDKKLIEFQELEKNNIKEKEKTIIKKVFRIVSPSNFKPDSHIEHGSVKYYLTVPDWAKNNSQVIVEYVDMLDNQLEELEENEKKIE